MARLFETKVDQNRVYFHGSSEAKVEKLEAPSFEHPFYVTSDLHYAMAFCTKNCSNTGDWNVKKTFTPSSQNYVYVVTLNPNCNIFDFRDHSSNEFKKIYSIIDKDIINWIDASEYKFDRDDIYEFMIALQDEAIRPVEEDKTYQMYHDRRTTTSGKEILEKNERMMPEELFEKIKKFIDANGLQGAYENMDIHEIMAPILKGLNRLGFQGILTVEHDYNDENPKLSPEQRKVTTNYAIGIFDVSGLDQLGLVPMKYAWLKKINPRYYLNKTDDTATAKVKKFIQLYKRFTVDQMKMNESQIDATSIWYFGNNRSKNLRVSKPEWYAPFFMTTDYKYAEGYADYGVYTITLKSEAKSKILDFNKDSDVKKLKWPKVLIDDIRTGKSDLNGIAYDMYILAGYGHSQEVFDKSWYLSDAAYDFDVRSKNIFDIVPKHANWAREKDHRFVLQMWKDIYDAGFDGFTHIEFGKKILALFNFQCMDKISIKPIDTYLNERLKNRIIKKKFKTKGQKAFPEIKTDDDIVFVSNIPKDKALYLLKRACHDVSNFHPEYMEKAVKWGDDQIFGVFNKHDNRNVLALASVSYNGNESGAAYLHEMTGFIKGGYGKKLVLWLLQKFKKVYGQIALEGSSTNSDPYRPNEKLRDKFYATIPGVKIYRVENSVWDCPADFFYYGISDGSIKEFLEKTYGSKESLNEDGAQYEPPYSLEQIKAKYPEHIYNKLANDPVHKWRAETRIELIHKEPTEEELDRIWKNWQLMPQEMKDISDKKSIEMFGCTNAEHYNKLKASEDNLNENKATYLQKYSDEVDVKSIVDMFWAIRNRLNAPQNDIDWWIKKPYNDLKNFVLNFDTRNKSQRKQENYKQQAMDDGAKLLDTKDGYEIWYVPTYEAMVILGRFYKGRSAKWCVASDDPSFWFENHDEAEFMLLIRENPKGDEFDKVAIEFPNHGRYYNEDDVIPWDLENNDWTFDKGVIDNSEELVYYAWQLFKDNGETRDEYYG